MYNIYSVFRNLFILTLIVLLLTFIFLKSEKIHKICMLSLIISFIGFSVSGGLTLYKVTNAIADYFGTDVIDADIKLKNGQLIVNGNERYNYKYDHENDEIILDKINSNEKVVVKVFGK